MADDEKTQVVAPPETLAVGTQLSGTYELDARLASGGMGEVFKGHNIQTGDPVAIKIVLPEFARDATILALFRKEASILNHLSHEAIVRYHVFAIDQAIGRPYLAMEFVDGVSLVEMVRRGPMSAPDVAMLLSRVASGLAAAHEAGVIHRDLSPDNIILPGGKVKRTKIIDFGIARSASVGGETLLGGAFAGKYNFVSPEQLGMYGGEVTERSDIYSLGLVIGAACRGEPYNMSGSQVAVIEKRRSVPDLSRIHPELQPIVQSMLQPDPNDRPPSMAAIAEWARQFQDRLKAETGQATQPPGGAGTEPPRAAPQPSAPATAASVWEPPPTQPPVAPPASAPPPPARAASAVTESPFGPYTGPSQIILPGSTGTGPAQPPGATAQRRGRGGIVAAAVIGLLAASAAGAYYAGALDGVLATPEPTVAEAPAQPPAEPTEKPAEASSKPAEPTPPQPPTKTAEDQSPAEPPAQPPPTPVDAKTEELARVDVAEPPAATPVVETPVKSGSPEPGPADKPAEPVKTQTEVAMVHPDEPAVPPSQGVDAMADRLTWVRGYDGGNCFFASAVGMAGQKTQIEGFGDRVGAFQKLLADYGKTFGGEPDIAVRLIRDKQCPLTDFLNRLRTNSSSDAPDLELVKYELVNRDPLSGSLSMQPSGETHLYLVDHDGIAHNLDGVIRRNGETAQFSIPLGLEPGKESGPLPQVLLAIATSGPVEAMQARTSVPAADLLPKIADEIQRKGLTSSATARYFRIRD
jgi:serine/threonine-protein kinase